MKIDNSTSPLNIKKKLPLKEISEDNEEIKNGKYANETIAKF